MDFYTYRYDGGLLSTCWGTWDDFWQETAISGASNAGKAREKPYLRRLIWIIIFAICLFYTITGVVEVFVGFYEYPVSFSVSIEHKNKVSWNELLQNVIIKEKNDYTEQIFKNQIWLISTK